MKFEYEASSEDKDVVAYIDEMGSLVFPNRDTDGIICLHTTNTTCSYDLAFDPKKDDATKVFYRGDSIKITF